MEFLKAMEQAKQFGLSKDEFLPFWRMELQDNIRNEAEPKVSSGQNYNDSFPRDDSLSQEHFDKLNKELADMKIELKTQFQCLHNQVKVEQETRWENVKKSHKSIEENFNRWFEMLSKHVTNTVDSQAKCMKMSFVYELEMIKADVMRKLEGLSSSFMSAHPDSTSVDSEGELPDPNGTFDQHQQKQQCKQLQPNHHEEQQVAPAKKRQRRRRKQHQQHTEQQQKKQQQIIQTIHPQGKDNKILSCDAEESNTSINLSSPPGSVSSEIATGAYAMAISKQMKCKVDSFSDQPQASCSREDQLQERHFSTFPQTENITNGDVLKQSKINSDTLNTLETIQLKLAGTYSWTSSLTDLSMQDGDVVTNVKILPDDGVDFIISNCANLRNSNKAFYSPFFQPTSKTCNVRVQLKFNPVDQLEVQLLVSRDKNINYSKQPIVLRCYGNVYNPTSRSYSALFQLRSEVSNPLQIGDEIAFKALVYLGTVKHSVANVTYKILKERAYIVNDEMKVCFFCETTNQ